MKQFIFRPFILLLLLLSTTPAKPEENKTRNKTYSFYGGAGIMAYKNTQVLYAGLPGDVFSFSYRLERESIRHPGRQFKLTTRFDYAALQKRKYSRILPHRHLELSISGGQEWLLPLNIPRLLVSCGGALSFNGTFGYNNSPRAFDPYGNWHFATDILSGCTYRLGRFKLSNTTRLPFLAAGFFPEYEYHPLTIDDDHISYYFKPNTLATIPKYFHIENYLSVSWVPKQKKEKFRLYLTYSYSEQNIKTNNNQVKYRKNMLFFGISIKSNKTKHNEHAKK